MTAFFERWRGSVTAILPKLTRCPGLFPTVNRRFWASRERQRPEFVYSNLARLPSGRSRSRLALYYTSRKYFCCCSCPLGVC
jgi:hypothetical protein